jgi:hypothetical protein
MARVGPVFRGVRYGTEPVTVGDAVSAQLFVGERVRVPDFALEPDLSHLRVAVRFALALAMLLVTGDNKNASRLLPWVVPPT